MSITKKSNIRSRWYRANEKPLESGTNPQINEPKGEISISEDEKLVDDLSSAKPPPQNSKEKKELIISKEKTETGITMSGSIEETRTLNAMGTRERKIQGLKIIIRGTLKEETQEKTK